MAVSRFRILVVGEVTQWGRHFVSLLQTSQGIEFVFEKSVDKFLESTQVGHPQIVMVENMPGCRSHLASLRESNRRLFLFWLGRSFSKEDLAFAIQHRIYGVFEDPKNEDPILSACLRRVSRSVDSIVQSEQVLRSLKSTLLQHETDADRPFLAELKTAVAKLERMIGHNELASNMTVEGPRSDGAVPFHEAQAFSDALSTVHDLERTGVLRVRGGAQQDGAVEFLQGKLISAATGGVTGIKALFRMFLWDDVRFAFTRRDVKSESIQPDLNGELHFICQQGDELKSRYQKIRKEIPPAALVLAMEPKWMQITTAMPIKQFSTLASVIEFGQVGLVLDYNPLPDVDLLENLIALKRTRAIKVVSTRAPLAL